MTSDLRCPRCAAHAPAGAAWCSLCYADLRPSPPVAAEPEREAPTLLEAPEAPQAPVEPAAPDVPPRGKHARRAPAPGDRETASAADLDRAAAEMLAQLAASESAGPLGRFSPLVDSPAKKVGLMVGGAVLAMLVLFIIMAVVGSVL